MAYRMTYLRVNSHGYASRWQTEAEKAAFKEESRRLFQDLGWQLHAGRNGVCDTVTKDSQDLYLHPTSFSGVMAEANIQPLQERLSTAHTFHCYAVDCYEEYMGWSDEEYRAALEAKRGEISSFILEQCRTKRSNLYITGSVADCIAQKFEIRRLCDRDRHNGVGRQFSAELVSQLVQDGRLVIAATTHGEGIRTATEKELRVLHQPAEQINGQISMTLF